MLPVSDAFWLFSLAVDALSLAAVLFEMLVLFAAEALSLAALLFDSLVSAVFLTLLEVSSDLFSLSDFNTLVASLVSWEAVSDALRLFDFATLSACDCFNDSDAKADRDSDLIRLSDLTFDIDSDKDLYWLSALLFSFSAFVNSSRFL